MHDVFREDNEVICFYVTPLGEINEAVFENITEGRAECGGVVLLAYFVTSISQS